MNKVLIALPLLVLASCNSSGEGVAQDSKAPTAAASAPSTPEATPSAVATVSVKDEDWECNSGYPTTDAGQLHLFDLKTSEGATTGSYRLGMIDASLIKQGGRPGDTETGTVRINGDLYTFAMTNTTCRECGGSFLLSPSFRKGREDGKPVLNEKLSRERQSAFRDENFDGMEQVCGPKGYMSSRF